MIYEHLGIQENLLILIYLKINTLLIYSLHSHAAESALGLSWQIEVIGFYQLQGQIPLSLACLCMQFQKDEARILDIKTLFY